jgi:hypothetical protein
MWFDFIFYLEFQTLNKPFFSRQQRSRTLFSKLFFNSDFVHFLYSKVQNEFYTMLIVFLFYGLKKNFLPQKNYVLFLSKNHLLTQRQSHYNYRNNFALEKFEKVKILVSPKMDKNRLRGLKKTQKNHF